MDTEGIAESSAKIRAYRKQLGTHSQSIPKGLVVDERGVSFPACNAVVHRAIWWPVYLCALIFMLLLVPALLPIITQPDRAYFSFLMASALALNYSLLVPMVTR